LITSPIAEGNLYYFLKDLLSLLPSSLRLRLTNGYHMLQYLSLIDWNEIHQNALLNQPPASTAAATSPTLSMNLKEIFHDFNMKEFLFPFVPSKWLISSPATADSPWNSSSSASAGVSTAFTEITSITASSLSLVGNNTLILPKYTITCKTSLTYASNPNSYHLEEYDFYPHYPLLKSDNCLASLMKTMNFLFSYNNEFPSSFQCYYSSLYPIGIENAILLKEPSKNSISVSQLIVQHMQSIGKSSTNLLNNSTNGNNKKGNIDNTNSNNSISKIPDDLIINYFSVNMNGGGDTIADRRNSEEIKNQFLYSLAG
jgi:hypothetical protein